MGKQAKPVMLPMFIIVLNNPVIKFVIFLVHAVAS